MSAQALAAANSSATPLRPFNMRKDLLAVADLVELCFKKTLDEDGRMYIRQMRQTANNNRLLNLALGAAAGTDMPPGGYVWEEGGTLIGNLSLIPIAANGKRFYLIANVAVHPDFRRRGIARELTQAALAQASNSSASEIWLQADHDNQAALELYQKMGFVEKAHRIAWTTQPYPRMKDPLDSNVHVRKVRSEDWALQKQRLDFLYPEEIRWNLPFNMSRLQPGLMGSFQRLLGDRQIMQWAADFEGKLIGVLSWQSSSLNADRLWFAGLAGHEEPALNALYFEALKSLKSNRRLLLNYPARIGEVAFESLGFSRLRELIWMQLDN